MNRQLMVNLSITNSGCFRLFFLGNNHKRSRVTSGTMGADPNCGTKVQKIFDICKFLECRKWKNAKKKKKQ